MPRSAVNLFNDILLTAQNLLLYVRKALGFDEESGYKKEQAIADLSRKADQVITILASCHKDRTFTSLSNGTSIRPSISGQHKKSMPSHPSNPSLVTLVTFVAQVTIFTLVAKKFMTARRERTF